MPAVDALFADYGAYHQTPGNKWCHRIGIPMIMLSLFGMLSYVEIPLAVFPWLDAALILIGVASLWYFAVDWRFGVLMIVVSLALWAVGSLLSLWLNVALFVGGWILQFVGHGVYEHKAPAFAKNLTHLLVGPMWILDDMLHIHRPERPASQDSIG